MRFHFQGTTSVGYFSSSNHLCLLLLFFLWLSEAGLVSLLGARRRMVVVHVLFSLTVSSKDGARCPQDPMEGTTVSLGTYSVPKSLGFWAPIRVILASCGLCLTLLNCFKKKKRQKEGRWCFCGLYSRESSQNPVIFPHTLPKHRDVPRVWSSTKPSAPTSELHNLALQIWTKNE